MKKLLFTIIILSLLSCSKETTILSEYDINGVWTGNGDYSVFYSQEPLHMDIEFVFNNNEFIKFYHASDGAIETLTDGKLTRTENEIYIEIFKTSKDGTNRALLYTFTGSMLNESTIVGSLLLVWQDVGDNGDFILRK